MELNKRTSSKTSNPPVSVTGNTVHTAFCNYEQTQELHQSDFIHTFTCQSFLKPAVNLVSFTAPVASVIDSECLCETGLGYFHFTHLATADTENQRNRVSHISRVPNSGFQLNPLCERGPKVQPRAV